MLGRHADRFMINQFRSHINAVPANGEGQSLPMPDRERAGTPRYTMQAVISSGPDTVIDGGDTPGATPVAAPHTISLSNGYRPGAEARGIGPESVQAGPGLFDSHLGADPADTGTAPAAAMVAPAPTGLLANKKLLLIGAALLGGYLLLRKRK